MAMIEAMVLGVYHMANPKLDLVKSDLRDTLGDIRQQEIAEVVASIARFRPTKVIVEAIPPAESLLDRYQWYLGNDLELGPDEREQLGFRIAKLLGHSTIYPVDYSMKMDFDWLTRQGDAAFQSWIQTTPPKIAKILEGLDQGYAVNEILVAMNSPEGLAFSHSFYMEFLRVEEAGAAVLAAWYERNLRIFAQIRRIALPEDRLLILYGAGHAKLLSDFIRDTFSWKHVDPLGYLSSSRPFDWRLDHAI
ncbi:MAG: hypothetical protein BGO01_10555 [Armatimonadetes bacterium 55-13]|nr:MAG: hypothetical protein BGO01_10555 [Armatimonadetes bacterium 55-13]